MICTWCNRSSRCPNIWTCSSAESQTAAGLLLCRTAKPQSSPNSSHRGVLKIGAIHTYLELYARMLVDLTPQVALVVADKADRDGNLYTGPNTEDTPGHRRSRGIPRRHRRGAGQRDRRYDLPRVDIPSRLDRFRGAEPESLI